MKLNIFKQIFLDINEDFFFQKNKEKITREFVDETWNKAFFEKKNLKSSLECEQYPGIKHSKESGCFFKN